MQTGAIFARGSCRALKWMALFGVVFSLGAGVATAQVTVTGPDMNKVVEGGTATYTVAVKGYRAAGAVAGTVTVTLGPPTGAAGNDATSGESTDISSNLAGLTYSATVPANAGTAAVAFSSSGSIVLQTLDDRDAEDENFTLAFTASDVGGLVVSAEGGASAIELAAEDAPTALTIDDDETQTYVLELVAGQTLTEGDTASVTLKAVPEHEEASLALTLHSSDPVNYVWDDDNDDSTARPVTISVGPTDATVPGAGVGNSTTVYVTAPDNDKNRIPDMVTLTAYSGSAGNAVPQDSVDISFADDHTLAPTEAVTAVAMDKKTGDDAMEVTSVVEGADPVYLTISVDRGKAADKDATTIEELTVDVKVAPVNAADASVTPTRVTLPAVTTANGVQKASMMVELSALADEDVGGETLTLHLEMMGDSNNGSGSSTGMFEIMITDDTDKRIWPKPESEAYPKIEAAIEEGGGDNGLNPGDSFMVMTNDLFGMAMGYTASYGVSVEGGSVTASSSGESVTVMANSAGEAKVTITGTARMAGSGFIPEQTVSNSASITFPVEVVLADLSVSVEPDSPEIMEGSSTMLTATANRAVTERTKISLLVVGDMDAYKLHNELGEDVDGIEIPVGATTGVVTLSASEDDDYMDETLTVVPSGPGIDGGSMRFEIMVTDNDEAPVDEPTVRAEDGAADMIATAIATAAGDADWMVGGMAATVDMSMLFDVDDGVTAAYVGVSSDDAVVKALNSGTMLTLTPMAAGSATITVTGSDADSGSVATVMHDAMVSLQTLVVTVSLSDDMVMEGGSVTLTATANREATEDVMLAVTVTGDTAAVDADEMITISMGDTSGVATVMAVEDDDSANAMVSVVVSGSVLAPAGPASFDISIEDDDPTLSARTQAEVTAVFMTAVAMAGGASGWLPGGDAAMVDMSGLFTTNGDPTVEYMVESSAPDMIAASASGMMLTLTPMDTGDATITVTATDTSGDMYDTAAVMADVTVGVLPLEIMVSPTTAEVDEGGTVEITATANKMVDANVEVMLVRDATSSAVDDDYSLEPRLITIMAGDAMGKTTLTATDDYDVEGNESLTLVARVKDHGDVGTVMVSIMDNDMETTYELSGPMDTNIVEGMEYELTATANQAVHMDTEVMLMRDRAASDAGDDDYSVGSIMIMAGEMSGTTMLMVTEDNMPDAGDGTNMGESLVLIGSVDGMEVGTLEFIIWDAAVPALPIIAQLLLAAFLAFGGYRRYRQR